MQNLFSEYSLDKFKIKKPRKNEETTRLIEKLSEISGWQKRSIYFQVPHQHLQRAINYCEGYSTPQARNAKLKEFVKLIHTKK